MFESVLSSAEIINSQSVQLQVWDLQRLLIISKDDHFCNIMCKKYVSRCIAFKRLYVIIFDFWDNYVILYTCGRENFFVIFQVTGSVPTITIDKSDGVQIFLSKDSLNVEIVTAKSSEMNVSIPNDDGEFVSKN